MTANIKSQINQVLDTLSQEQLEQVLQTVTGLKEEKMSDSFINENLKKIMNDNDQLLHNLAQ